MLEEVFSYYEDLKKLNWVTHTPFHCIKNINNLVNDLKYFQYKHIQTSGFDEVKEMIRKFPHSKHLID